MFVFIFILAIQSPASSTCISLLQGYNEKFNGTWDISCYNGQQLQETIQFTQEFCEPPKIIIRSVSYSGRYLSSFSLKILTSTTTQFQFQLQCKNSSPITYFKFYWGALIEDKILIFNDFMQSIPLIDGYRTRVIPYPLQNTDYEFTILITSYSGGDPYMVIEKQATGFNLYVSGVSSTYLSGLGVQIIAGLKSLYTLYDSLSILVCQEYHWFPKMSGYIYQPNKIMIVVQQNINEYLLTSSGGYIFDTYIFCQNSCPCNPSINFKLYLYEFLYFPHYFKKIRVAQMMSLDYKFIDSFDTQRLFFIEANQTWIDSNILSSTIEYKQGMISLVYNNIKKRYIRRIQLYLFFILPQVVQSNYNVYLLIFITFWNFLT